MTPAIPAAPRSRGDPRGRVAWLDLAKATSIVLVVLYHVAASTGHVLLGDGPAARWWSAANLALIPLRMPLFFVVAGVLAARAVERPFRTVLRARILDLLWPYVLWSLLFAAVGWPRYAPEDPWGFLGGEVAGLLVAGSPYWFIAVLPIFFVLTKLLREHRTVLLALTFAAYAAAPFLHKAMMLAGLTGDLNYGVFQLTDNALWYAAGFALHPWILRAGERPRMMRALLLGAVFVPVALVLRLELPLGAARALELVASLSGIGACIALLPLLARWQPLARAASYLGPRTLLIYLVHPIVLNILVALWRVTDATTRTDSLVTDLLLIPVVAVGAILIALALDLVIDRWGPSWLTSAPRRREMRNSSARTAGRASRV